jgi:hypothetical protein
MGRTQGTFTFSNNLEVKIVQPLDARSVTTNYADLKDGTTIIYPYSGMLVSVVSDSASTTNNGLYICTNPGTAGSVADGTSVWEKIGSGTNFTGNTWTYSSNTLNLNYQGGTFPVTGFTFLNLSGGTVSGTTDGLLTLSGTSNPLRIFGITGNSTNNYLVWDSTNGNVTYRSLSAVTGGSYVASAGTIYLSGNTNQSISGFSYLNQLTVSSSTNTISGYTNISGNTPVFGGVITAVTGGTYTGGTLYLSGTGIVSTGVTISGFVVSLSAVTGGSYVASAGTLFLSGTGVNPPISGFNYVVSGTVTNSNTISAQTNTATTFNINFGTVNAFTGGTFSDGNIYMSGTGLSSTGYTISGLNYVYSGTVTNDNRISAQTINSLTNNVYFGQVNAITGATYDATGRTLYLSGTGSLSSGVVVSQQFDYYGLSSLFLDPSTLILSATSFGGNIVTANASALASDRVVTGGTYDITTGEILFRTNSGNTFPVTGFTTGLTTTTGATYYPSQGIIEFTKTGAAPAYSANGFNYVTGFTVSSSTNAISGYTNISGNTAVFGGIITAVTGGTYTGGTLYLSGTGLISTGITISGFSTNQSNAVLSGGVNNYLTKWTGSTALTVSQIYDDGSNVGIGLSGTTNKLHISASTNPIRIEGIQQSAQTQSTTKFLMIDDTGTVFWNNVTPTTGISIYVSARTNSGQVDFIPTGTPQNYRSVNYNYQLRKTTNQTIRSGTLQAVWSSGATGGVNYTDMGPLQFLDAGDTINYIAVSGVTGGVTVDISVSNGNWEFKAYKVLL